VTNGSARTFCTYEDRESHAVSIQLLALSLQQHDPQSQLILFTNLKSEKLQPILPSVPNLRVRQGAISFSGWDVKPAVCLKLLQEGHDEVVWIDTDILVCGSVNLLLDRFAKDLFITTEEPEEGGLKGTKLRTKLCGLAVGRPLEQSVNSGVLRVTADHRELLQRWLGMLESKVYRVAQGLEAWRRPRHLFSDQDLLGALLGSSEFSHLKIALLKAGVDIAQCLEEDGYSVAQRTKNVLLRRMPTLIHTPGYKPWTQGSRFAYLQVAPYTILSRQYAALIDGDTSWMWPRSPTARCIERLFRSNPHLCGVFFALPKLPRRLGRMVMRPLLRKRAEHIQLKLLERITAQIHYATMEDSSTGSRIPP
jgi:hypothetical protein